MGDRIFPLNWHEDNYRINADNRLWKKAGGSLRVQANKTTNIKCNYTGKVPCEQRVGRYGLGRRKLAAYKCMEPGWICSYRLRVHTYFRQLRQRYVMVYLSILYDRDCLNFLLMELHKVCRSRLICMSTWSHTCRPVLFMATWVVDRGGGCFKLKPSRRLYMGQLGGWLMLRIVTKVDKFLAHACALCSQVMAA